MNFNYIKKHKVISSIVIFVLILGGLFLWLVLSPDYYYGEVISDNDFVHGEEFDIVTDDLGKRFIVNEKEGFKAGIPVDWSVYKHQKEVDLLSPELKVDEYGGITVESIRGGGCGLGISIMKSIKIRQDLTTDAEFLSDRVKRMQDGKSYDGEEIVLISNHLGIRETSKNEEEKIIGVTVEIPIGQSIYSFNSLVFFGEKCITEFNNFLETVSIEK